MLYRVSCVLNAMKLDPLAHVVLKQRVSWGIDSVGGGKREKIERLYGDMLVTETRISTDALILFVISPN